MNRQELKEALRDLAQQDPEFMKELIGEVVKSNLSICTASDGDYYNPGTTYVLEWKTDDYSYEEFSKAY
jgi:hypothetical protein